MTKNELMSYVGQNVCIRFKDGKELTGILRYAKYFSEIYNFRKPNYFYIENNNITFKATHIKNLIESEE